MQEMKAHRNWREETCTSLSALRALRADPKLRHTVLRLTLDMELPMAEYDEAERILSELAGSMAACSRVVDKRRALSISKAKVREAAAKNGDSHHHWGSKGQESALLIVTVAKHDMAPLFCFLFRECVCAPVHPNARIM